MNVLGGFLKADYQFNFCDGPRPKCHGQEMNVAEFMEFMGVENKSSCSEIGSLKDPEFQILSKAASSQTKTLRALASQ